MSYLILQTSQWLLCINYNFKSLFADLMAEVCTNVIPPFHVCFIKTHSFSSSFVHTWMTQSYGANQHLCWCSNHCEDYDDGKAIHDILWIRSACSKASQPWIQPVVWKDASGSTGSRAAQGWGRARRGDQAQEGCGSVAEACAIFSFPCRAWNPNMKFFRFVPMILSV